MATMTSKLPTSERPLIQDPDLAKAVEALLAPYEGKRLERAQQAVRRIAQSAVVGPFGTILTAYRDAVLGAVGDGTRDRDKEA